MTPDQSAGRILTLDEAMEFYKRCMEAEKSMGALTYDDRLVILGTVGKNITIEELADVLAGKRVLVLKSKEKPDAKL